MQTYQQTFGGAQTWRMNISGRYFTLLSCALPVNIRLYMYGRLLDLGVINSVLAGIEVMDVTLPPGALLFDGIEIDVGGADTIKIGIGNGQARNSAGSVTVSGTVPVSGTFWQAKQGIENKGTVFAAGYANAAALAANTPVTLIAPGTNTNGILVASAFMVFNGASGVANLMAKSSAPATPNDGIPLLSPSSGFATSATHLSLNGPVFVPAGLGIYFINAGNESSGYRGAAYTVL